MEEFPVIPGNIYQVNYRFTSGEASIADLVLGYTMDHPEYPNQVPAVVTMCVARDSGSPVSGKRNICGLKTFQSLHLPLGQRLATTTELMIYKGGQA